MKQKLFLTAILIVAIFYVTKAQVPSYVPTNGLVGWWPFSGNANDLSGNGNNGTVNGATLTTDRFGNTGNAYSFNGINNHISINPASIGAFGTSSFSLLAWFKTTSTAGNAHGILTYDNCMSGSGWSLRLDDGYGTLPVQSPQIVEFPSNRNGNGITGLSQNDGIWHQLVGVRDVSSNKLLLYQDGILTAQFTFASINNIVGALGTVVEIGSCASSYAFYDGSLDDIGIWNRALTQQEITALYNAQACPKYPITLTAIGSTTFCVGNNVTLNATNVNGYNYKWYNNTSLLTGQNGTSFSANQTGLYKVIIDSMGCRDTSNLIAVNVNPLPNNNVSVSGATTFCSGNTVTLTAQGNGNYLWSNGAITNAITVNQTGNYSVTVTANGCSATSSVTTITVNPTPSASITTSGATTFCQGGLVTLTANGGGTYLWNTNSTSASINANQSNTYSVTVTANGCSATASQLVTVNPNPIVSFTMPSIINFTSSNLQLNGSPTGGTYSGAGVSGSIFQPSVAGLGIKTITYSYTNANGCSNAATQSTLVYDTVICSQTIHTYDTIPVYDSIHYAIYDTTHTMVYDTITVHKTVNDTITHYLAVTDTLLINAVLMSVPGPNTINLIKVFPNPASDHLIINYGNYASMSGYSVKVTNSIAQTVYSSVIVQQQVSIDLATWSGKGTYILNIINGAGTVIETRKIVLQ
jgi:Concanavalin A-like lectin/glucanases superfamily/Secretion system C-terminal sorting domain